MRIGSVVGVIVIFVGSCTSSNKEGPTEGRAIAMIVQGNDITVVFTAENHQDRIDEVAQGNQPKDFHWASFVVAGAKHDDLFSAAGLTVDLASAAVPVRFSQVYRDTCNPALQNFSPCWLYESYVAGEPGLSGSATLRLSSTQAFGSYEVSWEGITDRFGPPPQQHGHQTISSVAAVVVGGAP